ncbi:spermatogenesis-defective protein 39 homolog [Planococcus citri]|uniref:spermatogenesis-defective protein 39 homolog n=1 Tax=Planococcus citri TaxID=170843 RepID=UPI0031F87840
MNSSENDAYWNESVSSKFDFELEDSKGGDLLLEDVIDTSGYSKSIQESTYYSSGSQSLKVESISNYLSEHCINCILEANSEKNELSFHHVPIDEEVVLLRRKLKERWTVPKVQDTVKKILLEQPYSLELYRSLVSKKNLLKCAVESADGDAILAVTVYLSKTLKSSLFHQLLIDYPVAASHFIHYLYTRRQMQELSDILEVMGNSKEAMMKYLVVASQNPHRLQQRLRLLLKNPSLEPWDQRIIEDYINLVEWQISASKTTGDQSIIGESPVQSLKFSCVRKLSIPLFGDDSSKTESQQNYLSKNLGVPKKLALMAIIRANAELKQWEPIEQLLVSKNWVGGKKLSTNLPIDKLLYELQKSGAPDSLLSNVLLVLDVDKRIEVARRLSMHTVVIEAYGKKKDKGGLLQYMSALDSNTAEYMFGENILGTMGSRW